MNLESIMLNKISIISLIHGIKTKSNKQITKEKKTQIQTTEWWLLEGEEVGWGKGEVGKGVKYIRMEGN